MLQLRRRKKAAWEIAAETGASAATVSRHLMAPLGRQSSSSQEPEPTTKLGEDPPVILTRSCAAVVAAVFLACAVGATEVEVAAAEDLAPQFARLTLDQLVHLRDSTWGRQRHEVERAIGLVAQRDGGFSPKGDAALAAELKRMLARPGAPARYGPPKDLPVYRSVAPRQSEAERLMRLKHQLEMERMREQARLMEQHREHRAAEARGRAMSGFISHSLGAAFDGRSPFAQPAPPKTKCKMRWELNEWVSECQQAR